MTCKILGYNRVGTSAWPSQGKQAPSSAWDFRVVSLKTGFGYKYTHLRPVMTEGVTCLLCYCMYNKTFTYKHDLLFVCLALEVPCFANLGVLFMGAVRAFSLLLCGPVRGRLMCLMPRVFTPCQPPIPRFWGIIPHSLVLYIQTSAL